MTTKQKVIQYIQQHPDMEHLRELSFGCEVKYKDDDYDIVLTVSGDKYTVEYAKGCIFVPIANRDPKKGGAEIRTLEIIGHPPRLNDYLAVLVAVTGSHTTSIHPVAKYAPEPSLVVHGDYWKLTFSLKTGEPATEEDFRKFAESIKLDV